MLLLMQFSFVTSHEYSRLVRRHLEDHQPHAAALGESLRQMQEFDADGYGIYHELAYFFDGAAGSLHLSGCGFQARKPWKTRFCRASSSRS